MERERERERKGKRERTPYFVPFCHKSYLLVSPADVVVSLVLIGYALILIIGCFHIYNLCSDWPCPGLSLAIGTTVYLLTLLIGHISPTL